MDTERATHALPGLTPSERAHARGLVDRVVECERTIARAEGEKSAALAELAALAHAQGERSDNPDGVEYARRAMAGEVAAATRTHPTTAKHQLGDAEQFVEQYPETHRALCEGRISARHARVITDAGGLVDLEDRGALDRAVVAFAEEHTAGELGKIVKRHAAEIAAFSPRVRHQFARSRRFASLTERDDGMSDLLVHLPTFEARAIFDRATEMAKVVKTEHRRSRKRFVRAHGHAPGEECAADCPRGAAARGDAKATKAGTSGGLTPSSADGLSSAPGAAAGNEFVTATDTRTTDQLRVDILTDLLLSAAPSGHELHMTGNGAALENVNATVQVTIPVEQMIDPDVGTSWIDAGGLVSPDTARIVAGQTAGWERLFYRSDTGTIERTDHYRPTAAQRRALIGRDITCRFPGCTTPARRADVDHTHDYARGGRTELSNLAHLCEPHHMMKHQSEWSVRQLPYGVLEWTSPTGHTHRDAPASRVFFQPPATARDPHADDDPPWSEGAPRATECSATSGRSDAPEPADGFSHHLDDLERRRQDRATTDHEHQILRDRERRARDDRRARAAERRDDRADRDDQGDRANPTDRRDRDDEGDRVTGTDRAGYAGRASGIDRSSDGDVRAA